jgi:hypothetical protein
LRLTEIAARARVSTKTVKAAIRHGHLKVCRVSGRQQILATRAMVDDWILAGGRTDAPKPETVMATALAGAGVNSATHD